MGVSLLIDENLPPQFASGLTDLGFPAHAVGTAPAPGRGSTDRDIVNWCLENSAVWVTADRGRKDRVMLELLPESRVSLVLVDRRIDPRAAAKGLVRHYEQIAEAAEKAMKKGGTYRVASPLVVYERPSQSSVAGSLLPAEATTGPQGP